MTGDAREPLWRPSPERIAAANVTKFIAAVRQQWGTDIATFKDLYDWSIKSPDEFWQTVWSFCGVIDETRGTVTLENRDRMPGARFFPAARLNFAENLLRRRDESEAIVFWGEDKVKRWLSADQLYDQVSRLVQALKAMAIQPGDRIAGFVPNMPETVIATLAAASIGAIWSSCSPDFGARGVIDRFGPDRPARALHRRRLLLQRQGPRFAGPRRPVPAGATDRRARRSVPLHARIAAALGPVERRHARGFHRALRAEGDSLRAAAVQSPALHHVFVGHDGRAEMHRPRCWRHAAAASEGASPALRHSTGRPHDLLHDLQLDDVELADLGPGLRGDAAALRRSRRGVEHVFEGRIGNESAVPIGLTVDLDGRKTRRERTACHDVLRTDRL